MPQIPNKDPNTPLSQRELTFIDNYMKHGNGAKAVLESGYNTKTVDAASVQASRMIRTPRIAVEIARRRELQKKDSIMSSQEVMEYFTAVARGEIKDQFGLDAPLSERTRAAQEIAKRTIDLDNKLAGVTAEHEVKITLDWARD